MNLHLYRCEACGIVRALEVPPLDRRCRESMLELRPDGEIGFTRCRGLLTTLTLGDFLTTGAGPAAIDICDGQAAPPFVGEP